MTRFFMRGLNEAYRKYALRWISFSINAWKPILVHSGAKVRIRGAKVRAPHYLTNKLVSSPKPNNPKHSTFKFLL